MRPSVVTALSFVLGALCAGAILIGGITLHNQENITSNQIGISNALKAQTKADAEARASCERSRRFSPYIAEYYEHHHVLPPTAQIEYEASIPRHC